MSNLVSWSKNYMLGSFSFQSATLLKTTLTSHCPKFYSCNLYIRHCGLHFVTYALPHFLFLQLIEVQSKIGSYNISILGLFKVWLLCPSQKKTKKTFEKGGGLWWGCIHKIMSQKCTFYMDLGNHYFEIILGYIKEYFILYIAKTINKKMLHYAIM